MDSKYPIHFIHHDSISGVPPQLIGRNQGILGAENRLSSVGIDNTIPILLKDWFYKDVVYDVSIENTLIEKNDNDTNTSTSNNNNDYDIGCVIIKRYNDCHTKPTEFDKWIGFTDATSIPHEYTEMSRLNNWQIPAGHFYANAMGISKSDWHLSRGSKSRKQLIKETIIQGLYHL
jgi:hypothetical protein